MDQPSSSKRPRVENVFSDGDESEREYDTGSEYQIDSDLETDSDSDSEDNNVFGIQPPPSLPSTSRRWSNIVTQAQEIPFTGRPGMKVDMPGREPIDYFNVLANDDFYNIIVRHSNTYALEILAHSEGEKSRITRWKDLTAETFKVWLGLLLHMGTIRLNRITDYWKKHHLFNLTAFSQYMSRDKFLLILRALHFNDNEADATSLGKINPLIKFFNDRMDIIYAPQKHLSIDESLVLWRGRLIIRQYMKGKKAKYGIKLYILGESQGLAMKIIVYGGSADQELGGKDHTSKVVHKLMEGRTGVGHSLYMDNYYNSVPLIENLLNQKTHVTGTLRSNRKFNSDEVIKKKLKIGESVSQYTDKGICMTKWKDRREVLAISSEFDGQATETTNRHGNVVIKPKMIIKYNKFMSGIDFHDQMLAYYPIRRKTLRWYKKLGIHVIQTILLNAYYLYNMNSERKMSLYDFRLQIIEKLLGPPPPLVPRQRNIAHLPSFCPKDDHGKTKRRRCKYCWSENQQRKDSIFCCLQCPDIPGLCLEPCFRTYHERNGE